MVNREVEEPLVVPQPPRYNPSVRPIFADLKNDYIFRRIFATHPEILRRLLNDLLDRTGEHTIESLEYLPSEQLPLVEGAKLSILDVRCKDRSGTTFVVEMQLIHHPGFINRVVYNACKAYVGQLKAGEWYDKLTDIVAISICDFELWPDEKQQNLGLPLVPMLSRWNMTERSSKHNGLLQVQYAFMELPKVPAERPDGLGADLWAWLFVHAPELREVPAELPPGPYRDALELANQAKFTQEEHDNYEKVWAEIRQVIEIAAARWEEGFAKGESKGKIEGKLEGKIEEKQASILRILARTGISLSPEDEARIKANTDPAMLDQWFDRAISAKRAADLFS